MSSAEWMNFALVGSIAISWLSLILAVVCYGRLRKQAVLTQKLYSRLDHNLQITSNGSMGMGRRLVALEKQLQQVDLQEHAEKAPDATSERQSVEKVTPAAAIVEGLAPDLADAARLLNAGLGTEEVARRCGISRAEVSLMQLMHSQVKSAAA